MNKIFVPLCITLISSSLMASTPTETYRLRAQEATVTVAWDCELFDGYFTKPEEFKVLKFRVIEESHRFIHARSKISISGFESEVEYQYDKLQGGAEAMFSPQITNRITFDYDLAARKLVKRSIRCQ